MEKEWIKIDTIVWAILAASWKSNKDLTLDEHVDEASNYADKMLNACTARFWDDRVDASRCDE